MRLRGRVELVKLLKHIKPKLDYCLIQISFDELRYFGDYNDALDYLNVDVEYDVAEDVYEGEVITRIVNFADVRVIQTVGRTENIKLIPENATNKAVCNFDKDSLRVGDSDTNRIAFACAFEKGVSELATWVDFSMLDMHSKRFKLRKFTTSLEEGIDLDATAEAYVGHYLVFDVQYTKYGMQASRIEFVNMDVTAPPEVDVAITQIQQAATGDEELMDYMYKNNFLSVLRDVIYDDIGYHLVEIASEIYLINAITDISDMYDKKLLIRAAIASRGYLLPAKTKFSRPTLNVNVAMRSKLVSDRELILILDLFAEERMSGNKRVYLRIRKLARLILEERRGGIIDEKEEYGTSLIADVKSELSGLL